MSVLNGAEPILYAEQSHKEGPATPRSGGSGGVKSPRLDRGGYQHHTACVLQLQRLAVEGPEGAARVSAMDCTGRIVVWSWRPEGS